MHNTNKHTKREVRSFVFFFEKIRNGKGGGKAKVGRDTDKSTNNPKSGGTYTILHRTCYLRPRLVHHTAISQLRLLLAS